jgi:hypothetical protein
MEKGGTEEGREKRKRAPADLNGRKAADVSSINGNDHVPWLERAPLDVSRSPWRLRRTRAPQSLASAPPSPVIKGHAYYAHVLHLCNHLSRAVFSAPLSIGADPGGGER